MIVRRLKSIPKNGRGFSDFSLGHCDSFLCNTNTRYVLGPNKSVVSAVSSGRRHDSVVTPRLSRAHPRNIYQRAIHGRRASLITGAARCRAVLILRLRCAARQLPTRQCTCVRAYVCQWILTLGRGPVYVFDWACWRTECEICINLGKMKFE